MSARDFLFKRFQDAGIPEYIIAGILGNAQAESNFDPTEHNPAKGGNGAFGIFQWRGSRLDNLNNFAKGRNKSITDLGTQADFFLHEIKNDPYEVKQWAKVTATNNPLDAFDAFRDYYERSGGKKGDKSGYARGRSFTKRIYNEYSDPNYHFSTVDDVAAESARYPADLDPYAPPERDARSAPEQNDNIFQSIRESLGNFGSRVPGYFSISAAASPLSSDPERASLQTLKAYLTPNQPLISYQSPSVVKAPLENFEPMSSEMNNAIQTMQAQLTPNQPLIPYQAPLPLSNPDPARGDSFPIIPGPDSPPAKSESSPLNPFLVPSKQPGFALDQFPSFSGGIQTSAEAPYAQQGATATLAPQPSPGGVDPNAPNIFDSLPSRVAPALPGQPSTPGFSEGFTLGGISASTAPEPNPGDEKDPWNWKLALFEGLEAAGVGLGQMSVGQAVNVGGVYDRINRRKAGEAAAATDQKNAETASRKETRLGNVPADKLVNVEVVANMAERLNAPPAVVDGIRGDASGLVAKEWLTSSFPSDKPLSEEDHAAIAKAAANDDRLLDFQKTLIANSPLAAKEYITKFMLPKAEAVVQPIEDTAGWARIVHDQADEEEANNPSLAEGLRRLATAMLLPDANTISIAEAYTKMITDATQTGVATEGQVKLATVTADLDQRKIDAANDFLKNATKVMRAEAVVTANEAFADREDKDYLINLAERYGFPYADAEAKARDVAAETQEFRNATSEWILETLGDGYKAAANTALSDAQGGFNQATEQWLFETSQKEEANKLAARQGMAGYLIGTGQPELAELVSTGNTDAAMDIYKMLSEDNRPSEQKMVEWLLSEGVPESAKQFVLDLRQAATPKEQHFDRVNAELHAKAIVQGMEDIRKIDDLIPKLMEAQRILASGKLDTGKFTAFVAPIKGYLEDLGYPIGDSLGEQETLEAISASLIQFLRAPGVGAMSDFDAKQIQKSIFGLGSTEEKNQAIVQLLLHQNQKRRIMLNAYHEYFAENGHIAANLTPSKIIAAQEAAFDASGMRELPFVAVPKKLRDGTSSQQAKYFLAQEELGHLILGELFRMPDTGLYQRYDAATKKAFINLTRSN